MKLPHLSLQEALRKQKGERKGLRTSEESYPRIVTQGGLYLIAQVRKAILLGLEERWPTKTQRLAVLSIAQSVHHHPFLSLACPGLENPVPVMNE